MQNSLLAFFQADFDTTVATFVVAVFLSTLPPCFYKRSWPDVARVTSMSLCAAAAVWGIKIVVLALLLPQWQMGQLGGDRVTLMLGGLVALIVASREATANWRAITRI